RRPRGRRAAGRDGGAAPRAHPARRRAARPRAEEDQPLRLRSGPRQAGAGARRTDPPDLSPRLGRAGAGRLTAPSVEVTHVPPADGQGVTTILPVEARDRSSSSPSPARSSGRTWLTCGLTRPSAYQPSSVV